MRSHQEVMVSDNPRPTEGHAPASGDRLAWRRNTQSGARPGPSERSAVISDWLHSPTDAAPARRSATIPNPDVELSSAPIQGTDRLPVDSRPAWAPVGAGAAQPRTTLTLDRAIDDDDALSLFAPEWDEFLPDAAEERAERPWSRLRARLGRPTLLAAGAVGVAVLIGLVAMLRSDDSDSAELSTIGDQSSTTIATDVGDDTGIDAIRTGPEVGTPADGETALSLPTPAPPETTTGEAEGATDGSADAGAEPGEQPPAADGDGAAAPGSQADPAGATTGGDGAAAPGSQADPAGATPGGAGAGAAVTGDYSANLGLIQQQTIRNRNEDDSPYRETPSAQLVPDNHYGPRSDYLAIHDGNFEPSFPVQYGGQFRVACEFSHFAYDDPLVYPNQPGASHLHMFFGNTDTNAYSTADSIKNSGGSTCNGSELNRTGYWVPAMFDGDGNVRIPERIVVYYKGEGLANGNAEVFPDGAAMIASVDLNTVHYGEGGALGKHSYNCSDNFSGPNANLSNTMPACVGSSTPFGDVYTVLEVNTKFPQCWNGQDPGNPANYRHPTEGGWYYSLCNGDFSRTLVNLEYFVNYRVEPGESTADWYLSSDVSPTERTLAHTPGSTNHGDWWSGWHTETNQLFIDNCVNYSTNVASGCGFGYLTDGGPDNGNPYAGPALALREQYLGPQKVSATALHAELCPNGGAIGSTMAAAFCTPAAAGPASSGEAPPGHVPLTGASPLFCPVHRGMLASDPASPLSGALG